MQAMYLSTITTEFAEGAKSLFQAQSDVFLYKSITGIPFLLDITLSFRKAIIYLRAS